MPRLKLFRVLAIGQLPVFYFSPARFFSTVEFPNVFKPANPARAGEIPPFIIKEELRGLKRFFLTDSFFSDPGNQSQTNKERILPC